MTKLNHERPYFKYIDNLRRELRRDARRTDSLSFGVASAVALDQQDVQLLLDLLDALELYFNAANDVLVALREQLEGKRRSNRSLAHKRDRAEEWLLTVATGVVARVVVGKLKGDERMLKAYAQLAARLRAVDEMAWDTLNNFAMKSAFERVNERLFPDA